jgi:hypothetical protein
MISIQLNHEDLNHIRFAYSPLMEVSMSFWVLYAPVMEHILQTGLRKPGGHRTTVYASDSSVQAFHRGLHDSAASKSRFDP